MGPTGASVVYRSIRPHEREFAIAAAGDRPLTGFEQVLLAYIARAPYSAYGLKRLFSTTPASVYRPSPGALYPALRRLVGRGLLTVTDTVSEGRAQKLYQVTEAGRAAHLAWLREPVDPATVGNDIDLHLMRFTMMAGQVGRQDALAFLDSLATALEALVSQIERFLATRIQPDRIHAVLALQHGIAVYRTSLDWARSARKTLAAAPEQASPPPPPPAAATTP